MIRLLDTPFDVGDALKAFEARLAGAGGVVSFAGYVRPQSDSGRVQSLHLQAYSPMTETGIRQAVEAAESRWPLKAVTVLHRIGTLAPNDPIVFVATASAHRRAAFEAADFLMDYLKTEAVFWKQEVTETGARWIEPRQADYTDKARWAETGKA